MSAITYPAVLAARERIAPHVLRTSLRNYAELDALAGCTIWVKHENHQPTNSFKVRNGAAVVTALSAEERRRGLVAASRGNHGLGLAYAGSRLGAPVTICVPVGNNPEKNSGMKSWGARLIEEGRDYDEAVAVADRFAAAEGLRLVHSTNDPLVLAGAATVALEMLEDGPGLDALVFAVGGGSQAVGGITLARGLGRPVEVYGVQAVGASAGHDSWHKKSPVTTAAARTIADGIATRMSYELTFQVMVNGLKDFVTVDDAAIAGAVRLLMRITHNLVEPAGAAGLAGVLAMRDRLKGRQVGIVLSGGNIDTETLRRILAGSGG